MKMEKKLIITKKDVLILQKLLEDGRKSSASISKEINLGREIVNYRIKRLIKENLIVKFVPKINKGVFNFQEYLIFLKLNLDDEISKEKFVRKNIGNKYLIWTIKSDSGWDLIVRLYCKTFEEFKVKLQEILDNFSDVLSNYYTIISNDEIKESEKEVVCRKLFDCGEKKKDFAVIKNDESFQINEKDREILNILEVDARVQYTEIAMKLGISADTVKYRIEKMKTQNLIEDIHPIINFNKLGFISYAIILKFNFLGMNENSKISDFLKRSDSVIKAISSLNSTEIFLTALFNKENEVDEFIKGLEEKFCPKIQSVEHFKID